MRERYVSGGFPERLDLIDGRHPPQLSPMIMALNTTVTTWVEMNTKYSATVSNLFPEYSVTTRMTRIHVAATRDIICPPV
jgi:hypothetical protein